MAAITGLILAGENVTRSGSGTIADPYVMSSPAPARGEPVPLTLLAPATAGTNPTVTSNPDGSASLNEEFTIPGPIAAGDPVMFTSLPAGYAPATGLGIPTTGWVSVPGTYVALRLDINSGAGQMFVLTPEIPEGATLLVALDELRFWPAP